MREGSAKRLAFCSSGFHEFLAFKKYAPRPLDNFEPERGQYDPALGAVDQGSLEDILQLLYAGAQSRLRDVARPRRSAKVAVIGEQDEMLELAKSRQALHRFRNRPSANLRSRYPGSLAPEDRMRVTEIAEDDRAGSTRPRCR